MTDPVHAQRPGGRSVADRDHVAITVPAKPGPATEIAPGVCVHHLPGHSLGLQAVTVETRAGRLCLASDVAHFYDNIARGQPFPITAHVTGQLDGQEAVKRLAGRPELLIPGHDPKVNELFRPIPGDALIFDLTRPR